MDFNIEAAIVVVRSNLPKRFKISGTTGQTLECVSPPPAPAAKLRGYEVLPRNDYAAVMDHVANVGPLTISVDAGPWGAYSEGVFDGCSYEESIVINHLVQLVG